MPLHFGRVLYKQLSKLAVREAMLRLYDVLDQFVIDKRSAVGYRLLQANSGERAREHSGEGGQE